MRPDPRGTWCVHGHDQTYINLLNDRPPSTGVRTRLRHLRVRADGVVFTPIPFGRPCGDNDTRPMSRISRHLRRRAGGCCCMHWCSTYAARDAERASTEGPFRSPVRAHSIRRGQTSRTRHRGGLPRVLGATGGRRCRSSVAPAREEDAAEPRERL